MADVELRQIRYFVVVAREGSLSRAAERLAMTQPAVSRAIQALERSVGAELFVRGPRGVELTEAGRVLRDEAAGVDARLEAALSAVRAAGSPRGPLRVAVRGCDGPLADRLLRGFRAAVPEVPVEPVLTDPLEQPAALRSGACQLALVRVPFDARGLHSEVWLTEPRVALVAGGHPLAERGEVDLADLADDPVVTGPAADATQRAYWAGADMAPRAWREGPSVRDSLEIVSAVSLGQAIAFVPVSMVSAHPLGAGIRQLRVRGLSPSSLALAWDESLTSVPAARFVRFAQETAEVLDGLETAVTAAVG